MVTRLLSANVATNALPKAAAATSAASGVAIATRLNAQTSVIASNGSDAYSWSSTVGSNKADASYTTPVWDYSSGESSEPAEDPQWEYAYSSSWAGHDPQSPAAHYLNYTAMATNETAPLIDVYA
jgi:hypothetical protein